jgi:hypothetical protein
MRSARPSMKLCSGSALARDEGLQELLHSVVHTETALRLTNVLHFQTHCDRMYSTGRYLNR